LSPLWRSVFHFVTLIETWVSRPRFRSLSLHSALNQNPTKHLASQRPAAHYFGPGKTAISPKMMCLRQFLLFLILLPFPTAPPLLMFMIAGLMWVKLRPCIYCSILVSRVMAEERSELIKDPSSSSYFRRPATLDSCRSASPTL
jgi:hypothetical protein